MPLVLADSSVPPRLCVLRSLRAVQRRCVLYPKRMRTLVLARSAPVSWSSLYNVQYEPSVA